MPKCPECGTRWYYHDNYDGGYFTTDEDKHSMAVLKVDQRTPTGDNSLERTYLEIYICKCNTVISAQIKEKEPEEDVNPKDAVIAIYDHYDIDRDAYDEDVS